MQFRLPELPHVPEGNREMNVGSCATRPRGQRGSPVADRLYIVSCIATAQTSRQFNVDPKVFGMPKLELLQQVDRDLRFAFLV